MFGIIIEKNLPGSQYLQLYKQLHSKILSGDIAASSKLPSSRLIASELNISRTVVLEVIDQLKIEGYLTTRKGSGTYVSPHLNYKEKVQKEHHYSSKNITPEISFVAGIPDSELFPRRAWNKCYKEIIEYSNASFFSYCPAQGHQELRTEVCHYLFRNKGISAEPHQIFITAGAAQGISLLARLYPHGIVHMEDPVVSFVPEIFTENRYSIVFGQVDNEGLIPESLPDKPTDFIYLSPSHQFPLGSLLSAQRRIQILKKAVRYNSLIIEDDYDGEFRYKGSPVLPMQITAPNRVIYLGSFSKILSPAIRLGYMVVPPKWVEPLVKIKQRLDFINEGLSQLAMAKFLSGGFMERHLRKSRKEYHIRGIYIDEWIHNNIPEYQLNGTMTGVHRTLQIPGRIFPTQFYKKLLEKGLLIQPVSLYCNRTTDHRDKIILGFGQCDLDRISMGLTRLKEFL